jgi:hypothetical protein
VHVLLADWKQIYKVQLVLPSEFQMTKLALNVLNQGTDFPLSRQSHTMGGKVLRPEAVALLEFLGLLEECRVALL